MESAELNNKAAERIGGGYEKPVCAIVFILAVIVAVWLRFDQIGIKPFHHDEGVMSHFLLNLANSGEYRYNPENYHGPTLYYFALAALQIGRASCRERVESSVVTGSMRSKQR